MGIHKIGALVLYVLYGNPQEYDRMYSYSIEDNPLERARTILFVQHCGPWRLGKTYWLYGGGGEGEKAIPQSGQGQGAVDTTQQQFSYYVFRAVML